MESRADAWAVLMITSGWWSRHDVDPAAHTWFSAEYPWCVTGGEVFHGSGPWPAVPRMECPVETRPGTAPPTRLPREPGAHGGAAGTGGRCFRPGPPSPTVPVYR